MKRKALLVLAVSSLCGILTAPLGAQTADTTGRFDIPFQFHVNGKTMPAGQYTVSVRPVSGLLEIESEGAHRQTAFSATFQVGNSVSNQAKCESQARLTFHRYGDQYFLVQISPAWGYPIRGLSMSPAEREAAKALSSGPRQAVSLAAFSARR